MSERKIEKDDRLRELMAKWRKEAQNLIDGISGDAYHHGVILQECSDELERIISPDYCATCTHHFAAHDGSCDVTGCSCAGFVAP